MRAMILTLALIGCAPDVGTVTFDEPNIDAYAQVHPFLEARCATLDCHGDEGRPLRLYAETGLRQPGVERDVPLTVSELQANAWSLLAVDPQAPPELHLAILKPLAESEGGMDHVGEDVFGASSNEAACLSWWLSGASGSTNADCEAANERWLLPE